MYKSSAESWCQCECECVALLCWHSIEIQFVGIIVFENRNKIARWNGCLISILYNFHCAIFFFCSLVIYTASLLAIQRIMSVRIVTLIGPVSLFFCLRLLSSSPSFRWFCKMFVCRFKQKTIHLRFIRFHERELLLVHTGFCSAIIIAGWHCCFE